MQWALAISNMQQAHYLNEPWSPLTTYSKNTTAQLLKEFGEISFDRLYFGSEFCERAMPGKQEIKEALKYSEGKDFTFVTPYVTETGLHKLTGIFNYLVKYQPSCEIVVNDWGVLHLLKESFPRFKPVLGRLLNKMLRDPRIIPHPTNSQLAHKYKHFQTCSLAGAHMKHLLKNGYKVKMIEIDNLPQGFDGSLPNWGYETAMYVPYGCVTTGRICFFQSWGLNEKKKFRTSEDSCRHLCRGHYLKLKKLTDIFIPKKSLDLIQMGNTVFYRQDAAFLAKGLKAAKHLAISRLIYQPEPF